MLDTHTVSNFCKDCEQNCEKPDWEELHKGKCKKNFEGSSNAMEVESAEVIFGRSIEKRGLVYGCMLCDGDSKALTNLNTKKVYREDDLSDHSYSENDPDDNSFKKIEKEDCANHISKHMHNNLENLKKSNKAVLNRKLTKPNIDKITNHYSTNLRL